jgi:hypothetical protein
MQQAAKKPRIQSNDPWSRRRFTDLVAQRIYRKNRGVAAGLYALLPSLKYSVLYEENPLLHEIGRIYSTTLKSNENGEANRRAMYIIHQYESIRNSVHPKSYRVPYVSELSFTRALYDCVMKFGRRYEKEMKNPVYRRSEARILAEYSTVSSLDRNVRNGKRTPDNGNLRMNHGLALYMREYANRAPQTPPGWERPTYLYRGMSNEGAGMFIKRSYIHSTSYISMTEDIRMGVHAAGPGAARNVVLRVRIDDGVLRGTPWIWYERNPWLERDPPNWLRAERPENNNPRTRPRYKAPQSSHPGEQEILLPPGTFYRVLPRWTMKTVLNVHDAIKGRLPIKCLTGQPRAMAEGKLEVPPNTRTFSLNAMPGLKAKVRREFEFRTRAHYLVDVAFVPDTDAKSMQKKLPITRKVYNVRNQSINQPINQSMMMNFT